MSKDAAKRALRTFVQGVIATLALLGLPILNNLIQSAAGGGEVIIDVNAWRTILIAVIAGGLVALISWAQNELEAKTGKDLLPK